MSCHLLPGSQQTLLEIFVSSLHLNGCENKVLAIYYWTTIAKLRVGFFVAKLMVGFSVNK